MFCTHDYPITHTHPHSPTQHRIYLQHKRKHARLHTVNDIPLHNDPNDHTLNMICEIPRFTRAKMEIDWKAPFQPIRQDLTTDGTPREYSWGPMPFNYGALPQTWENPDHKCEHTQHYGDDDPLDIIDIGVATASTGMVYRVKVLGVLGMIDQNETDWKVIAINTRDSMAEQLNDIDDVEVHKAGVLDTIREWLRMYKVPEGKPPNTFAFDEQYQNVAFAGRIVAEMHEEWRRGQG